MLMYNYFTHVSNHVLPHQIMNITIYIHEYSLIDVAMIHV